MNIILLGLMFDEKGMIEAKMYSKRGLQAATHKFQKLLADGLMLQKDVCLNILNVPPIGSFPINYRKIFIKEAAWGNGNKRIGYLNIPVVKKTMQRHRIKKEISRYLSKSDNNIILIYTLYEPFVYAALKARKNNRDIKICLLQTDAIAGRNGQAKYDSAIKKRQADRMLKAGEKIDCYILLTKYLAEPLEVGGRPYLVMEGICESGSRQSVRKQKSSNICLYTGTVNEEYGIKELVDSFAGMSDRELWICGNGDAVEYVKEAERLYYNIKYWGFKVGKEMEDIKDECDFLINPRKPTGTYTLYSFPSKTMEYLASGKPTIMYKLEGIPDEYDPYINYLDIEKDLREQLTYIFESDYAEALKTAEQGYKFVSCEKNAEIQAKRVADFLRGIID